MREYLWNVLVLACLVWGIALIAEGGWWVVPGVFLIGAWRGLERRRC